MRKLPVVLPAALFMTGCLTSGMYRTAHVLPQGEGDFALNFNIVRATVDEPKGTSIGTTSFTYPNLVPEVSYHYGAAENVEVGGRVALGAAMIELDTKLRFLRTPTLHVAVQPAVGYRSLIFVEGFHGTLPLIFTYDMSPRTSLNASVFGGYTHFSTTDETEADDLDFSGDSASAGGALGIQFRTPSGFHFMPAVEVQRTVYRGGNIQDLPHVTSLIMGVTLGWGANERARNIEQQVDRIEKKLDRVSK